MKRAVLAWYKYNMVWLARKVSFNYITFNFRISLEFWIYLSRMVHTFDWLECFSIVFTTILKMKCSKANVSHRRLSLKCLPLQHASIGSSFSSWFSQNRLNTRNSLFLIVSILLILLHFDVWRLGEIFSSFLVK